MTQEEIESLEYEREGLSFLIGALNEYNTVVTQSEYNRIEPRAQKRREQIDKILDQHKIGKNVKKRKTSAQVKALKAYNFAVQQEDRYLGSVFVTPKGQAEHEAKREVAYQACLALGMTHEHGL